MVAKQRYPLQHRVYRVVVNGASAPQLQHNVRTWSRCNTTAEYFKGGYSALLMICAILALDHTRNAATATLSRRNCRHNKQVRSRKEGIHTGICLMCSGAEFRTC